MAQEQIKLTQGITFDAGQTEITIGSHPDSPNHVYVITPAGHNRMQREAAMIMAFALLRACVRQDSELDLDWLIDRAQKDIGAELVEVGIIENVEAIR